MVFSLRSAGRHAGMTACFFAFAALCFAQTPSPVSKNAPAQQRLLPASFSGWVEVGAAKTGTTPAAIDQANADALNEYGLKEFAESTYRYGDTQASIRAMRFTDATGAYGAFTYYRRPGMKPEAIGNSGAGDASEVVFWSGVILVDAIFEHPVENGERALKALAAKLPPAGGSDAVAPTLPDYLPPNTLEKATVRYAIGPTAYARGGGVLPPDAIDFSREAEAVTAHYAAQGGQGTLTLIEYPTPQLAVRTEKALDALLKGQLPATLQQGNAAALGVHRSGPIVAVTSGNFSSAEAQALLAQVKYQAEVTWNRGTGSTSEVKNAASMLLGIAYLTGVVAACALLLGIFLGGGRALWRIMHGKPASVLYEEDFISLNLQDWAPHSPQELP
ncbi:MAG: DUF6599 family protein [Silvibacterium sp.]